MKCSRCKAVAQVALPGHHAGFCPACYQVYFSRQVDRAVRRYDMFSPQDRVLVALSGGKDSLAVMHELHRQGYSVTGLHIDLSIGDSSVQARDIVSAFCEGLGVELLLVSAAQEGLAIPAIKKAVPHRPVCSLCGKVKRYFFNKTALDYGFSALCTGHNLDDEAGRLFANVLRWDGAYLADQTPALAARDGFAAKYRPLYRLTEYETAAYCFFHDISCHIAACPYSTGASFTVKKKLMNALEKESPGTKLSFYESFLKKARPAFAAEQEHTGPCLAPCVCCGYPTSAVTCTICRLRELVAGLQSLDTGCVSGPAHRECIE